ncbi:hypothetical protein [Klebsiella sp. KE9767]|uniref:helix-turn-helix transcriptional regulator n=1 Tax=Klebsiella sp. KE9767 TaxID=3118151 RepID=UPI0037511B4B
MLLNNEFPATGEYPAPIRSSSGNMPGSGGNVPGWQVTLVDACGFGREGLRAALYQHFLSSGHVEVTVAATLALSGLAILRGEKASSVKPRCLVLRLPFSSREALHLLLQLGTLPAGYYERVVILSAVAPDKVRRMLISTGLTGQICLADDHLALSALCRVIAPERRDVAGDVSCHCEVLLSQPHRQFTPAEWRVLSQTLQGVSAREQARQAGTRIKTIYTQRACGLHKLKVRDIRMLLRQFWPVRNRMSKECPE